MKDFQLESNDNLTKLALDKGIESWNQLTDFIQKLPYGRNQNRIDFGLVLTEMKGTCSSKHALLKSLADLNKIPRVQLIMGVYKMSESNTPKIGKLLAEQDIPYIPEAHCYLRFENERVDFTSQGSSMERVKNDLLLEKEITPAQVVDFKVKFHRAYVEDWLQSSKLDISFQELWELREQCIERLSS